ENWTVHTDRDAVGQRVSHELPESRPGATLDAATAKDVARRTVVERFHIAAAALKDVSAVPSKLPERTDWTIIFSDTSRTLPRGELRLAVRIAGNEVADAHRFVYIPEDWERTERNAETVASIVRVAGGVVTAVLILACVIAA